MSDFEWGHLMPGEVVSAGRAGITSPSSRLINERLRGAW